MRKEMEEGERTTTTRAPCAAAGIGLGGSHDRDRVAQADERNRRPFSFLPPHRSPFTQAGAGGSHAGQGSVSARGFAFDRADGQEGEEEMMALSAACFRQTGSSPCAS